ncbi:MAG TPA: LiaF domain-containing protein [Chitinophagaceae bacterium]|jgi:predicted membrane protein|nr:LiaF domain-containing protein [Chitinophagaceae bacterium]
MTETQDSREQRRQERQKRREERRQGWMNTQNREFGIVHSKHSHIWTGIFILIIGLGALLKASVASFPDWAFEWPMLLIALGMFIGIRHHFRGVAWFVLVLIGVVFTLNNIYPEFSFRRYMWPVALICVGLFIIMRPRNRGKWNTEKTDDSTNPLINDAASFSKEDFVDSTSIFGGAKKIIISKNFKGGDLVSIFGGTELDLSQADFTGVAVIELTTMFGGTKLLVPSNWSVKSEAVTIFGGIEDKRRMQTITETPEKTLLLRGTVIFGGIDIKSF